jgi:hypothetical protein
VVAVALKVDCRLILTYNTCVAAEILEKVIAVDGEGIVRASVKNSQLILEIASAPSPSSLLHTLDDLFRCLAVAEKLIVNTKLRFQKSAE